MDETLHRGRFLDYRRRDGWEFVTRPGITGIVAMAVTTGADELILIEQYRPPVGASVVEIPAGLVGDEDRGEDLQAAAVRELEEETGYRATGWRRRFDGPPSAGLSDEIVTFFTAGGAERIAAGGGVGDEAIVVRCVARADFADYLGERQAAGMIVDPKVYAAAWLVWSGT